MKSASKLKNYLEKYTREKYFTDRITQIRKDIGIPENGIQFPKSLFQENTTELVGMIMSIKYKDANYPTFPAKRTLIYSELLKPIPAIYKEPIMIAFINIYILYNERFYELFEQFNNNIRNTVALIESRMAYLERKGCCDCELKVCEKYMDIESKKYPVMIGISPCATQNEVTDLVKKQWDYIQFHMEELTREAHIESFNEDRKQLSQIRMRQTKSKEIEDIVYKHKNLPLKEIKAIVKEKTNTSLGYEDVGKIKSLAIRRREKIRK